MRTIASYPRRRAWASGVTPSESATSTEAPFSHERPHRLHVIGAAPAEHDRLQQRGPPEAVDVIDLDVRLEQASDDPCVAALRRADEAGAVERVLVVHRRTGVERELEQGGVVADLARGDQVGTLPRVVLRVDVGTRVDEQPRGGDVVAVRRQRERRAPVTVADPD
jgi:hypothetical protein